MAAIACRVARRVSRHRSRWSSRLGYALERLDRARESRRDAAADGHGWLRWTGTGPAAQARRQALACEDAGDLAGAVGYWRQAVSLSGAAQPTWAVKLADLLDRAGAWGEAQVALRDNLVRHPRHPQSYRRLGEISLKLAQWGGAFTGTLSGDPAGARFIPAGAGGPAGADAPPPETAAREALERAAALEPAKTTWREPLAEARLGDGDLPGAIALYETALRDAEQSTGRWVLAVKQRWQFQLESAYARSGRPRVEDPLFACVVEPGEPVSDPAGSAPGVFTAKLVFSGLVISGVVGSRDIEEVDIQLDGVPIRALNVGGDRFLSHFQLELKRPTLAAFPGKATLTVRAPGGARLRTAGGAEELRVTVPHGSGRLLEIVAAGGRLDKKGVISPSLAETRQRQQRYLEIYAKLRDFFEGELGRPLFLMYGTLLGYHREGDFIAGDDDFDCGYVSDFTDPVAVKEETKRLIVRLVKAGFTVSFNRLGRLFRVQLEREATDGYHLDVRPLWFQGGRVWVHNHCSYPSSREEFLPVAEGELRGARVSVPRDTEAFLRGHYGPGWRTPDPGFMYYLSEVDQSVLDNLGKALITVKEYKELAARLRREAGDTPAIGRLVSVGSQDLYPLARFLP